MKFLITFPPHTNIDNKHIIETLKSFCDDMSTVWVDPKDHNKYCDGIKVQVVVLKKKNS